LLEYLIARIFNRRSLAVKKQLLFISLLLLVTPIAIYGRGGDAAIGGFVGGMAGSVVGSAISRDRGSSRAEEDARLAREDARQLRQERERDRYEQLERKIQRGRGMDTMTMFLVALIALLSIIAAFLGYVLMRRK